MTQDARYNKIGVGYDSTRKADPYLASKMYAWLDSGRKDGLYLDIGCGTGNYTSALQSLGLNFIGMDPSEIMLNEARTKNSEIQWKLGSAENIDVETDSMDGVLVSLTIHHWQDMNMGFQEVNRVMKKGSKVVIFTSTPEQTASFWLSHYFPVMMDDSAKFMPSLKRVKKALEQAQFTVLKAEPYFIKPDLEDGFLYCGKHDPEKYFNENVRSGISSFSLLAYQDEVQKGLGELRKDIDTGAIRQVMEDYENDLGDYLFLVAEK